MTNRENSQVGQSNPSRWARAPFWPVVAFVAFCSVVVALSALNATAEDIEADTNTDGVESTEILQTKPTTQDLEIDRPSPVHVPANPEQKLFRIATGVRGSTYFTIGQAIASILSHPENAVHCRNEKRCGPEGLNAIVQTSDGSARNALAVSAQDVSSALVQSDVLYDAYHGLGAFSETGPLSNLRILAALYPETLHLVVRHETGVVNLSNLEGKTVSIGVEGSGSYSIVSKLKALQNGSFPDFTEVYFDPYQSFERMVAGELDAFYVVGGEPIPLISTLLATGTGRLISPLTEAGEDLVAESAVWNEGSIQPALYPGSVVDGSTANSIDSLEPLASIEVTAVLVVPAQMSDDRVYSLTQALWHEANRQALERSHPQGRNITRDTAIIRSDVPLHPGAARYYRQIGLLRDPVRSQEVEGSQPVLMHKSTPGETKGKLDVIIVDENASHQAIGGDNQTLNESSQLGEKQP